MIDIKNIKKDINILKYSLEKRNCDPNTAHELIEKYQQLCDLKTSQESLLHEKNELSKQRKKFDKSDQINEITRQIEIVTSEYESIAYMIPNIIHESVPIGRNENDNKVIFESDGEKITNTSHDILANAYLSRHRGAKISGSRYFTISNKLATLYRKLANFMIDIHVTHHNYIEQHVPVIVNKTSGFVSGQIPKLEDDMYHLEDDMILSPTSELQLTNLYRDEKINALPIKMVALSSCFRKESGASGKQNNGIIRTHQFEKVELVQICEPTKSYEALEGMLCDVKKIFELLQIPYRVLSLCSGDIGFSAAKTYDVEAWMPGLNSYKEISSCSNCTDFQARRMNLKFNKELVHTLNGSGVAVGRMFAALIENHTKDGELILPEALAEYCNIKSINIQ